MITDVFLNEKRVILCEHTVKMESCEFLKNATRGVKRQEGGRRGGDGRKIKWKSSEVNTRAVSRGQNKIIGKFKMVEDDVISIRGRLWSTYTFQQELKGSL